MNSKKIVRKTAIAASIAALYVVLTGLSALVGLDKNAIQFRLSEMLTVLPYFCAEAIPGLFIGCALSSFLFGAIPYDIIFGSLATLVAAVATYILGKVFRKHKWLAPIPPIVANALVIPFVLKYAYQAEGTVPFFMLTVFIGEFVTCGILGYILLRKMPEKIIGLLTENVDGKEQETGTQDGNP